MVNVKAFKDRKDRNPVGSSAVFGRVPMESMFFDGPTSKTAEITDGAVFGDFR